jgi:hypothetical protein
VSQFGDEAACERFLPVAVRGYALHRQLLLLAATGAVKKEKETMDPESKDAVLPGYGESQARRRTTKQPRLAVYYSLRTAAGTQRIFNQLPLPNPCYPARALTSTPSSFSPIWRSVVLETSKKVQFTKKQHEFGTELEKKRGIYGVKNLKFTKSRQKTTTAVHKYHFSVAVAAM